VIELTEADIIGGFSSGSFQRGKSYWLRHHVFDLKTEILSNGKELVMARVKGSGRNIYSVSVSIAPRPNSKQVIINSECSCPIGYQCKHVVATLFQLIQKRRTKSQSLSIKTKNIANLRHRFMDMAAQSGMTLDDMIDVATDDENSERNDIKNIPYDLTQWLHQVTQALHTPEESQQCILYLLDIEHSRYPNSPSKLLIHIVHTRRLKMGGYGKVYRLSNLSGNYITDDDKTLFKWLHTLRKENESRIDLYTLSHVNANELLHQLLKSGRCYWHSQDTPPLSLGDTRTAQVGWEVQFDGSQRLVFNFEHQTPPILLPLTPLWYIDPEENKCGCVDTPLPEKISAMFINAPALPPTQADNVHQYLLKNAPSLPRPHSLQRNKRKKSKIVPHLYFFNHRYHLNPINFGFMRFMDNIEGNLELPQARLSFLYDEQRVPAWPDGDATVTYFDQEKNELVEVTRNKTLEAQARAKMNEIGLRPLSEYYLFDAINIPPENQYDYISKAFIDEKDAAEIHKSLINLSLEHLPRLRAAGWRIEMSDEYLFQVIEPELIEEWYADIEEGSGIDWFGLELGVSVEGEKINLLPLLVELLRELKTQDDLENLRAQPDDTLITVRLNDRRLLPLPVGRIRHIIDVLVELYSQEPLDAEGRLHLQTLRVAQLAELEAAMGAAHLRWFGGERLLELGRKLRDFKGIKNVAVPNGFNASLRHYQQEGLNWLQFLREYNLGGILADDMGLGKTVQTLAHLLTEKNSGRMDKPSLVVAPTSLMANWRLEAKRFTPELKVLTLHGPTRKDEFTQIAEHDVILTTYPLLARDKEALLAQHYHLLVLDEAQNIKNPKAKATQIAHQLQARHRLCLTGTPMENHLGELWSLTHFLMPGLLGDYSHFREIFRNPIEKEGDFHRREVLSRRIKPFMLRRTKQQVVQELPAKTEIVRTVEMDGTQLDLYETIRLTMHEKVRREIAAKGMARSQIIILDALLKLRQVCCDPRLVKLEAAKKVKHSAKLNLLMDLIPEMILEGRKILLFSQFTSMLSLIEEELQKNDLKYVKLTGQTRNRAEVIQAFQEGEIPLFLISLKAGGTGLNLTAADTVIHYDPWWNPAVENQATDRAHRIGQDKKVFVYKLITAGTVEEKIQELQKRKQEIADALFSGKTDKAAKLSPADLEALFAPLE
jgi:SNF2 family DNA or RNA helicase